MASKSLHAGNITATEAGDIKRRARAKLGRGGYDLNASPAFQHAADPRSARGVGNLNFRGPGKPFASQLSKRSRPHGNHDWHIPGGPSFRPR